ncbi:conserved unknown protein [Ectocarpus siliculosus]|uniref:Vms1-associating treble clef domain-containing protein n=1 Tax=Ectocarpus siliculosus TaxID=2880 RepID=D7FY28_ECTSI|nr:conserved unknown protein [Ectocarpus siliculosus]|eukprot:CBJ32441.1 conserved unknown protein [Ectocarpus siliculosus]
MIPTVLLPVAADAVAGACSSREELLHRATTSSMTAFQDNPITLANLCEARSSGDADRFRLFSFDEGVQELASLKDAGGGLLVECSTAAEGRDPSGLAEISRRTGLGIVLGASCQQTNGTAQYEASPETISKELEHQLLFGEHGASSAAPSFAPSPAGAAVAESASAPARIQAGFLLVKLSSSCCRSPAAVRVETPAATATAGSPAQDTHGGLGRAAAIELEGAAMAQQATGAPLMIACSHFVRWPMVVAALVIATAHWGSSQDGTAAAAAAATSRKVIVAGMHGGVSQSLHHQASLLSKGIVLCFDCFGRVEWLPGPDYYPSDEESAVRIAELVRQGFAERIILSSGVSRRFHLSRFGGYGYGHALRTVPPRLLRLGVSAKDIGLMTRDNMLGLLDWYTPPPPIEIPKDYLPCCWCKKRFEPVEGEYFHKFQFVYCNIKCLRAHRDTGFDADAAASK